MGAALTWLRLAAISLALVLGGAIGSAAALRIDGPRVHRTSLATVRVEVRAATDGRVEVYVPLVDWRVVTDPFRAPLAIVVETQAINRGAAQRVLAPAGARRELERLRAESVDVLHGALQRAALVALVGGVLGGALAGALVGAVLLRRRDIVVGAGVGLGVAITLVAWSSSAVGKLDVGDLRAANYSGRAAEVPVLLAFSQQLLHVGKDYEDLYARALDSLDNLRAFAQRADRVGDTTLLLASDIHNNEFVLDAFDRYAGDRTVLLAGDFGQVGARVEARLVPGIAALGGQAVAVAGNHDSAGFMAELEDAGVTVLGRDARESEPFVEEATGLSVLGYQDPLMRRGGEPHVLRVRGARYQRNVDELVQWYDELEEEPDVLLIHQHGMGQRLLEQLARDRSQPPLLVLAGHSHEPAVERYGPHVLIDAGTLGAGGPFAIGEQFASFAQLQFRGRRLFAVDIVRVDPISGSASSRRTLL